MDEKIEVVASGAIQELKALKAQTEDNIKSFLELNNLTRNIELKLKGGPATISDLNALVENAVRNINNMRNATEGVTAAQNTEAKTTKEVIALLRELNKLRKDVEKQQKAEEKQVKQLSSDYDILNAAYRDQIKRVRELFFSVGELHPAYVEAQQDAMRMGDTLKRVDAAVGIHNRNVGNYQSALANIGQIWRELPAAGGGLRTFIMALSNNLVPVIESLNQVTAQNKILAAQGQQTVSALGLIRQSLFSVTGVASLAVAAFTIFGTQLASSAEQAKETASAYDQIASSINKLIDAQRKYNEGLGSKDAENARKEIALLRARDSSLANSRALLSRENEERQRKIKILEEEGDLIFNIQAAAIDNKFTPQLIERANGVSVEFADALKKAYEDGVDVSSILVAEGDRVRLDIEKLNNDIEIANAEFRKTERSEAKKQADELKKIAEEEYKFNLSLLNSLRKASEQAYAEIRKSYAQLDFNQRKDKPLSDKDVMSFLSQDTLNYERFMFNELADLNKQYQDGTITNQEVFEKKRTDIIRKWTIERLKLELKAAEQSAQSLTGDDRVKALNQVASINKQITDLEVEQFNTANQNKIRNLNDFLTRYKEVLSEIANFSAQIGKSITQNELAEIQERRAQLDIDFAKRKEYLAATSATEIEYQKKLAGAEAERASKIEQLRQEEIAAKQKQAIYDKIAAGLQAGINTALAITAFLARGDLAGATAAGILGTAQVLTIAATPLPQYAKGTDDTPNTPFIAAEGNKPEILEHPDGSMYMLSKEGVYTAPQHSRVIPQNEWASKLPFLSERLLQSMQHQQQIKTDKMENYLASIDRKIGKINRPVMPQKNILLPTERRAMK